jgi:hypothetical protein
MIRQHAVGPTRLMAVLMICASFLLAAIGYGVLSVRVVRDPSNPAFVGNTIETTTTTSVQPLRDPQNPYWTGATMTEAGVSGAGSGFGDQINFRGATQGLR